MTTAPTPSQQVWQLSCALEIAAALPDMPQVTIPRIDALEAAAALQRLERENDRPRTERHIALCKVEALEPELRRLQAENERLQQLLQCDTPRYCSSVQRCTAGDERRAKLEARKPLPVSVERLDELWASQRGFHGGEPLKMGHVEFARLIEVEYGVLGRIPMREENGGQIDPALVDKSPNLQELLVDKTANLQDQPGTTGGLS